MKQILLLTTFLAAAGAVCAAGPTGREWQDAALYDLCLNTGHMSEQQCVDIVRAYMDARFAN